MIAFDLPPPAIIAARPLVPHRFFVNDGKEHDCGPCLPRDFAEMPWAARALVRPDEIRAWLPEPYRRLSDDMLRAFLAANIGGLPGVVMAGQIKQAWLYTASDTFRVPGDWNRNDNWIGALGSGGDGRAPTESGLFPGTYYGGPGGGGSAFAALFNRAIAPGTLLTASVATTSATDTYLGAVDFLLAKGGGSGGSVSGGTAPGGAGGDAASCVGDFTASGETAANCTTRSSLVQGSVGGSAAGPRGAPLGQIADAGFGGRNGLTPFVAMVDGEAGIYGSGRGWFPGLRANVGSGGGGGAGTNATGSGADANGHDGGAYGAGAGGAGVAAPLSQQIGVPGKPSPGCLLIVNNASL
jgi:hypothetical protein